VSQGARYNYDFESIQLALFCQVEADRIGFV